MELYVATLIEKCYDGELYIQIHTATNPSDLAKKIDDALSVEENERDIEIPRHFGDILTECKYGNQHTYPFSMTDTDNTSEFILATTIKDI